MDQPDSRRIRDDEDLPEPPQVRRLRLLVTTLMVVLILGMVIVVAAMVVRLGLLGRGGDAEPVFLGPVAAERLVLPEDAEIVSLGRAEGQVMVWTREADGAETLRIFDASTGAEISATPVVRE